MHFRGSRGLWAILLLALVVRVGVVAATPDFRPILDAAEYHRHAVFIANGSGYPSPPGRPGADSAYRPPLYPIVLAAVYKVGGGNTAGRLLGALLGVAVVLLVYLIALRLWGRRVALVAGGLTAVFPPLVLLNVSLLSEQVFLPLLLAALLFTLQYRDDRRLRWAALAGFSCGLAALTRANGLLLILAMLLGVWTVSPRTRRDMVRASLALLGCSLLVIGPWALRNSLVFDRFVGITTQGGYALALTYNAQAAKAGHPGFALPFGAVASFQGLRRQEDFNEAEIGSRLQHRALTYIGDHPFYVVKTTAWNTLRLFDVARDGNSFDRLYQGITLQALGVERVVSPLIPLSLFLVVALAVAGIFLRKRLTPPGRAPPFVWSIPLLMWISAAPIYGVERYRTSLDPFLMMLAAVGIVAVAQRWLPQKDQQPANTA